MNNLRSNNTKTLTRKEKTLRFRTTFNNFTEENIKTLVESPKQPARNLTRKSTLQHKNIFGSYAGEVKIVSLPDIDKFSSKPENPAEKEKEAKSYKNSPSDTIKRMSQFMGAPRFKRNFELTPLLEPVNIAQSTETLSPEIRIFKSESKKIPEFKFQVTKNNFFKGHTVKRFKIKINTIKAIETEESTIDSPKNVPELSPKKESIPRIGRYVKEEEKQVLEIPLFVNYCYKEEMNNKFKRKMEDFHSVFKKNEDEILFVLCDGHGGDKVAKYAKERFPDIFFAYLAQMDNNVEKTLQETIKKLENELNFPKAREMGSTLSIIYICRNKQGTRHLYCGNVGDTRCILVSYDKVNRMSYDHKCEDRNEVERLRQAGGYVQNGRLMGIINLSRSLGDMDLKKYGLISFPNFYKVELTGNEKFAVMASDGVWDVLSDVDVYKISQNFDTSEKLVEELVGKAIEYGSRDNISCLAIKL